MTDRPMVGDDGSDEGRSGNRLPVSVAREPRPSRPRQRKMDALQHANTASTRPVGPAGGMEGGRDSLGNRGGQSPARRLCPPKPRAKAGRAGPDKRRSSNAPRPERGHHTDRLPTAFWTEQARR
jgi:hypothetical protein